MKLPNIELVSAKVHEAWIKSKLDQGVISRLSETGEEMMVPYEQLSEACKDLDRNTVKAVYAAIEEADDIEIKPLKITFIPIEDFEAGEDAHHNHD